MNRLLALILLLPLAACDNSIDPLAEGDVYFAIYGVLDMRADTQYVRVEPVRGTATTAQATLLDAEVWTENPAHGLVTWQDSLVQLDDGTTGHLFHAPFRPRAGTSYTLHVERSDGARTSATTRIPAQPELVLRDLRIDSLGVSQPVLWKGIHRRPRELRAHYRVLPAGEEPPSDVDVPYLEVGRTVPEGWLTNLDLDRDVTVIRSRLGLPTTDSTTVLLDVELETTWRSADWSENDAVENGVGFLGGIAHFTMPSIIPAEALNALRLIDGQSR